MIDVEMLILRTRQYAAVSLKIEYVINIAIDV